MTSPPTTRPSLLVRIRDARDAEAWSEFVRLYSPLVYRFARRKGLQDADAADLTQEVMRAVMSSVRRLDYDPNRGSFRGWLFTLAHRRLYDFLGRREREYRGTGDSAVQARLEQQPAREDEDQWNREYQQHLLAWAAERVRDSFQESTWSAFWQTAVEGRTGKEVAEQLGMTVAAVYLAKSRVMARLKECIRELEGEQVDQ
jgi:RNA polymerase sigma-70 factor (ECF subfamily)